MYLMCLGSLFLGIDIYGIDAYCDSSSTPTEIVNNTIFLFQALKIFDLIIAHTGLGQGILSCPFLLLSHRLRRILIRLCPLISSMRLSSASFRASFV
jgi:hypothetical protein